MINMTTPEWPCAAVLLRLANMRTYRRTDGILTTPLVSPVLGAQP